jgi:hypothetical protein
MLHVHRLVQNLRCAPCIIVGMALFRIVRIADEQEIRRYIDLQSACVSWVKDPQNLRVDELPTGTVTQVREVPADERCEALLRWFRDNKHFTSDSERKDMEILIRAACSDFRPE